MIIFYFEKSFVKLFNAFRTANYLFSQLDIKAKENVERNLIPYLDFFGCILQMLS